MARQKILAKPYEVLDDERDKKPITKLSDAQEVILKYKVQQNPPELYFCLILQLKLVMHYCYIKYNITII